MARTVCMLANDEAEEAIRGTLPGCGNHRHISPAGAMELIQSGKVRLLSPTQIAWNNKRLPDNASSQAKTLFRLAAEKFPQVVAGGLVRTEHKPKKLIR